MGLDMFLYREKHYSKNIDNFKELKVVDNDDEVVEVVEDSSLIVTTQVAYWRKANQIHKWFMGLEEDSRNARRVCVSIGQLQDLRALCKEVKSVAKLAVAPVSLGTIYNYAAGEVVHIKLLDGCKVQLGEKIQFSSLKLGDLFAPVDSYSEDTPVYYQKVANRIATKFEIGQYIQNVEDVARLLPTCDGFFFGSTEYDEYYLEDIDNTIRQLDKIIEDYNTEIENGTKEFCISYYYEASW